MEREINEGVAFEFGALIPKIAGASGRFKKTKAKQLLSELKLVTLLNHFS